MEANQLRRQADDAVEDLKSPLGGMSEAPPIPEAEFPEEAPPPPEKEGLPAGLTEEEGPSAWPNSRASRRNTLP